MAQRFGNPHLEPGESRHSPPLNLPWRDRDFLLKVTVGDAAGHRVTAWDSNPG